MKKTFSKVCGAVLASALFLAGCSNITQGAMSSDTIIPLDKPKVTAIAYPGLIYYSWTAVPGTDTYKVQILNNNIADADYAVGASKTFAIFKTETDGIEYTFRVSAVGTAPRAVTTLSSEFGEAKATSIVPPTGTHALDFVNYEGGKKKTKKKGDAEDPKALTAEEITVNQNEGSVYVGFNGKAYLSYEVALDKDYEETQVSSLDAVTTGSLNVNKNDTEVKVEPTVLKAGTYTVNVKAFARENTSKYIADMVTVADKVTYESFADIATEDVRNANGPYSDSNTVKDKKGDADYKYLENVDGDKNIRISWTPVKVMGKTVPTSYYKLYTKAANSIALTPVEATVVESQVWEKDKLTVVHYFDTTVADPTISNDFIIVLTNEGKYADAYTIVNVPSHKVVINPTTTSISVTGNKTDADADGKVNDIVWTITRDDVKQTIKTVKVISKDMNYVGQPQVADFASATDVASTIVLDENDSTTYTMKSKDLAAGQYYIMVVVGSETTQDFYTIAGPVTINPVE